MYKVHYKDTFLFVQQEVRFKVHDPKAYSKGGTLENTINGSRGGGDEEAPPPPPHLIHASKVCPAPNIHN